jgi:hypothetical protein
MLFLLPICGKFTRAQLAHQIFSLKYSTATLKNFFLEKFLDNSVLRPKMRNKDFESQRNGRQFQNDLGNLNFHIVALKATT